MHACILYTLFIHSHTCNTPPPHMTCEIPVDRVYTINLEFQLEKEAVEFETNYCVQTKKQNTKSTMQRSNNSVYSLVVVPRVQGVGEGAGLLPARLQVEKAICWMINFTLHNEN